MGTRIAWGWIYRFLIVGQCAGTAASAQETAEERADIAAEAAAAGEMAVADGDLLARESGIVG